MEHLLQLNLRFYKTHIVIISPTLSSLLFLSHKQQQTFSSSLRTFKRCKFPPFWTFSAHNNNILTFNPKMYIMDLKVEGEGEKEYREYPVYGAAQVTTKI